MLAPNFGINASQRDLAVKDLLNGLAKWRLWGKLGWNDILQRYRLSALGPLWITASMAIMVVSLGAIYASIFKTPPQEFIPFLCIGLLVWGYISSILLESGSLFTNSTSYIKAIRLPYTFYVMRFMWSKIIIFAHNFIIYFGVLIYFQIWPGVNALLAIPGLLILTLNGALISIVLGMVSTRFRDIPQIIASATQILFFITPVIWRPTLLKDHVWVMTFNPFYHLFEVARLPLLGEIPSLENYLVTVFITLINLIVTAIFFTRFRSRIAYWV